jgi:hypothetical protein
MAQLTYTSKFLSLSIASDEVLYIYIYIYRAQEQEREEQEQEQEREREVLGPSSGPAGSRQHKQEQEQI